MAVVKIQKKVASTPQKAATKKAKPKKGSLEAIHKAFDELRKHNVDLSYIME